METARVGYSQEEDYFNRINRELIEKKKSDAARAEAKIKDVTLTPLEPAPDPKTNRLEEKIVKP